MLAMREKRVTRLGGQVLQRCTDVCRARKVLVYLSHEAGIISVRRLRGRGIGEHGLRSGEGDSGHGGTEQSRRFRCPCGERLVAGIGTSSP